MQLPPNKHHPLGSEDSWLLSRISQARGYNNDAKNQPAYELDTDSGLESNQEEHGDNEKVVSAGDDDHRDEMQEIRINLKSRNCKNIGATRPKIPQRLCKVTKV